MEPNECDKMGILDRLLEATGKGQLLRGAIAQPNDLTTLVRRVHERTFYKLTGKKPLPPTIQNKTELAIDEHLKNLSPVRRLARRGL